LGEWLGAPGAVTRRSKKLRRRVRMIERLRLARHELPFGSQPIIEIVPVLAPARNKPFVRVRGNGVADWISLLLVIRAPSLGHIRL
jgi:hypothetical protein